MAFKHDIDFAQYQELAAGKIPESYDANGTQEVSRDSVADLTLGLCGQLGTLAADLIHGSGVTVESVTAHLGASLWHVSAIASLFDIPLERVASMLPGDYPPTSLENPRTIMLELSCHAGLLANHLRAACYHRRDFDFAHINAELFHVMWRIGRLAPIFGVTLGDVARTNVKLIHQEGARVQAAKPPGDGSDES